MNEKFFRRKLKNGMTVLMEKRDLPVVAASISNQFGAVFEKSGEKGIAHVIEHLLFTGTKKRSHEEISGEIEKKGGILNAFTDHEITSYWFKLPSEHLFAGLDVLADMLNNTLFKEEKFEKEKRVILEEIKLYHDDPQKDVFEEIETNLYEKPFGELIIGNAKTVSSLKRDFVIDYFNEHYLPENYIVTIVGDADFEKVCKFFEKNFKKKGGKMELQAVKMKNNESIEKRPGIDQANYILGMHAPKPTEKDYFALELLNSYLADGMSSKLFLEIREKRGLAYSVRGYIKPGKNYSYYLIYAGIKKEAIGEIKEIILKEFEKISEMKEKDLEEARQSLIGYKRLAAEDSTNVMTSLLYWETFGGAEKYYDYENNLKKVKLADIKALAKKLTKSYSIAAIVPK